MFQIRDIMKIYPTLALFVIVFFLSNIHKDEANENANQKLRNHEKYFVKLKKGEKDDFEMKSVNTGVSNQDTPNNHHFHPHQSGIESIPSERMEAKPGRHDLRQRQPRDNELTHNPKGTPLVAKPLTARQQEIVDSLRERLSYKLEELEGMATSNRQDDETVACGSERPLELSNFTGVFTSPNYPDSYPSYSWCDWVIPSTNDYYYVLLDFSYFNTSDLDLVSFYQDDPTGTIYASYSGSIEYPDDTVASVYASDIYIRFQSNFLSYPGFKGLYTKDQACAIGNGELTGEGTMTSPFYPETFTGGVYCSWYTDQLQPGQTLVLDFSKFDVGFIDTYGRCGGAYLEIYDYNNANEYTRYCGSYSPTTLFLYTSNYGVRFVSLSDWTPPEGQGFSALYTVTESLLLRLYGGVTEGRLEVFYNESWGSVCSDFFSDNNNAATVACHSLGYSNGNYIGNTYGAGTGEIWMDDVVCDGTEYTLLDCQRSEWGEHNCDHSKDVSIQCYNPSTTSMPTTTTPGTTKPIPLTSPQTASSSSTTQTVPTLSPSSSSTTQTVPTSSPSSSSTTQTVPTSSPPADVAPNPYISITMSATFTIEYELTMDCSDAYMDNFRDSFEKVVGDINTKLLDHEMCTFLYGMRAIAGDVRLNEQGTTVSIKCSTWSASDGSHIMNDIEKCSFEVETYLQDVNNWPDPIIAGISGCPDNYMDPNYFEDGAIAWELNQ